MFLKKKPKKKPYHLELQILQNLKKKENKTPRVHVPIFFPIKYQMKSIFFAVIIHKPA